MARAAEHMSGSRLSEPSSVAVSFIGVGYCRAPAKHLRPRGASNEALNRLLEFSALFRAMPKAASDPGAPYNKGQAIHYLRAFSANFPTGAVIGVADKGEAAGVAVVRIAAGLEAPTAGEVRYNGRVFPVDAAGLAPFQFRTVAENLGMLAKALRFSDRDISDALLQIRSVRELDAIADLPAYRVPKQALFDMALAAACLLPADIVAIPDMRSPSPCLATRWERFVQQAPSRGICILLAARKLSVILPWATHLALIENGNLLDLGPADIAAEHLDILGAAAGIADRDDGIDDDGSLDEDPDEEANGNRDPNYADAASTCAEVREPGSLRISQSITEGGQFRLSARDRLDVAENQRQPTLVVAEHDFEARFELDLPEDTSSVRPCLEILAKETLPTILACGPELRPPFPERPCLTAIVPGKLLSPATWALRLTVSCRRDDGSEYLQTPLKHAVLVVPETSGVRPFLPLKWRGLVTPQLEIREIETFEPTGGLPPASIRISTPGESGPGAFPSSQPIDIDSVWPVPRYPSPGEISMDIMRGKYILTRTPAQHIELPGGHVLSMHARIPAGLLAGGGYLLRLVQARPHAGPRDDPFSLLIGAEFRIDGEMVVSGEPGTAAGFRPGAAPLHADIEWHIRPAGNETEGARDEK
ncbi:hypothetical protein [Oricola nitratireducens]|uniref:hypothetical protein n=1 Tax=Oricola nitratireducens TaxID=2775868 RepID=UPI0018671BED|nr:hypothetical protein [Oricola nitratireducens]